MSRGFTGYSSGERRTRMASSLSFEDVGFLGKLARLPWGLVILITVMAMTGTAMLYSAAHTNPAEANLWYLHLTRFGFSLGVMIVLALLPLSLWMRAAVPAYIGTIVLLVLVELFGVTGGGAQRWLQIGPVALQPSEFAKLAVIIALAAYYQMMISPSVSGTVGGFLIHLGALMLILVPASLIFLQPDFGTTLALIASGGVIIFLTGLYWRVIALTVVGLMVAVPPVYFFVLADYQKERVDTYLAQLFGESTNALGESYQIEQAKIATGSGGWNGKGFMQGIQSQQDFVPEQHTDFILTVIAEEFGFIGTTGVLLAFGVILGWGLWIAVRCSSWFGRLAAAGATAIIAFYIVFNVGMVLGLLPVVGMPLPLISYGGTAMLTSMACFGLILSASIHHDERLTRRGLI